MGEALHQAQAPAPANELAERRKFGKYLSRLTLEPNERPDAARPDACERGHSATPRRTDATHVIQMICIWQDDVGSPISTRKFAPAPSSLSRFDMLHS
jgi:hypothetical protein